MGVEGQRAPSEGGMRPTQPRYANAEAMVAALKPGHPVYCVRPHVVKRAARDFLDAFDGRVLYATKCNPHPLILRALYEEGIRHFDTASLNEVAQVRELFRDAECYFMHPVKSRSAIRIAESLSFWAGRPRMEKPSAFTGLATVAAVLVRLPCTSALYV